MGPNKNVRKVLQDTLVCGLRSISVITSQSCTTIVLIGSGSTNIRAQTFKRVVMGNTPIHTNFSVNMFFFSVVEATHAYSMLSDVQRTGILSIAISIASSSATADWASDIFGWAELVIGALVGLIGRDRVSCWGWLHNNNLFFETFHAHTNAIISVFSVIEVSSGTDWEIIWGCIVWDCYVVTAHSISTLVFLFAVLLELSTYLWVDAGGLVKSKSLVFNFQNLTDWI